MRRYRAFFILFVLFFALMMSFFVYDILHKEWGLAVGVLAAALYNVFCAWGVVKDAANKRRTLG